MPYSSLQKTREHIREKRKVDPEWHEKQRQYARQYYLENKEKWVRARRAKGKENDTGRKYREMVNNLLIQRDGNVCELCGDILDPNQEVLHIDHILPRCDGGTHDAENIRLVHAVCNLTRNKHSEQLEELYNK